MTGGNCCNVKCWTIRTFRERNKHPKTLFSSKIVLRTRSFLNQKQLWTIHEVFILMWRIPTYTRAACEAEELRLPLKWRALRSARTRGTRRVATNTRTWRQRSRCDVTPGLTETLRAHTHSHHSTMQTYFYTQLSYFMVGLWQYEEWKRHKNLLESNFMKFHQQDNGASPDIQTSNEDLLLDFATGEK